MRRVFRWLFRLSILGIVLLVALVALKDTILKSLVEWRIRRDTGLGVTIGRVEMALLSPTLTMEGLKLYNTPEFGGSILLDAPDMHLEYDPRDALAGKIHLRLVRLHLKELNRVKNKAGKSNLEGLNRLEAQVVKGPVQPASAPVPAKGSLPMPPAVKASGPKFGGIDRIYLTLGTDTYIDQQNPRNNRRRVIGWKDYETKDLKTTDELKGWLTLWLLQIQMGAPAQAPSK